MNTFTSFMKNPVERNSRGKILLNIKYLKDVKQKKKKRKKVK